MFAGLTIKMLYDRIWVGSIIIGIATLFISHLLLTTYYVISGDKLIIKSGLFFNLNLNIEDIKRISETDDLVSSPALSTDRLEILYNKFDVVLISPKDKQGFIEELGKLNPQIEIRLKKNDN
jgi:hypothetical protein